MRIIKTSVRPALTYAAETRADTSKTTQMMNTVELRILRTIKGKTVRDIITNEDIRQ